LGIVFACCLLAAATARADAIGDDDNVKNCEAAMTSQCSADCANARCVAACAKQSREACKVNITTPQHVFNGPVISTPVACLSITTATCSAVSGSVANRNFFGGSVTLYAICPVRSVNANTAVIGTTCSSATDG